jgi:hypothetical protein
MKKVGDIPDSLQLVLRDFCHVESYETRELRSMIKDPSLSQEQKTMFEEFRSQLSEAVLRAYITPEQYLSITSSDCESNMEVVEELKRIQHEVFAV